MSKLEFSDRMAIGYALYDAGFKPGFSSDLCNQFTAGFGSLDYYGEWEYPLSCYELLDGKPIILESCEIDLNCHCLESGH